MSNWEETETVEAEALVKASVSFVNAMANDSRIKKFCKTMGKQHRTLQQSFSKLCYAWLRFQSDQYANNNFDGRNEYACKVAHKIMTDNDLKYETQLPLI